VAVDEAWLEALLDGEAPSSAAPTAAMGKLARLQQAFAELQWAELDATAAGAVSLFGWGHLEVRERIGHGGFGEVYRAFDPMLQREVALKLRRAGNQIAPAAGRAFIEEARRLAQVRHPHVLAVHGAAVHAGRAGIWTDLIAGETLAARIARDGPLSAEALLQMLLALSGALAAVHAKAIVHGDLTPNNVMCELASERYVLMDFGGGASLDEHGTARLLAGSLHFMAPEHLGSQRLGTAADMYALGATLVYAATRRKAAGDSGTQALSQRTDLSREFRQLVSRLLAQDPDARPNATEVRECSRDLLSAPDRRKRLRLRQALFLALTLAVIASVTGLLFTLHTRAQVEVERNRAVATRDFLLKMMQVPNPTQSMQSTQRLDVFFKRAVEALPAAFADDPQTEAMLLNQFARSLQILDQEDAALVALVRADQILSAAGVPITDPDRIDARDYLGTSYRLRRNFPAAIALDNEQAALCLGATPLPLRTCINIVNDQIQSIGYGGDPARALKLAETNLQRAHEGGLDADDRTTYTHFLQGIMQRDLGQSAVALESFLTLSELTLRSVPAEHPALFVGLAWLAWSADDLGDVELAMALNEYAAAAYAKLFGVDAHHSMPTRVQQATLAFQAGDSARARAIFRGLMKLPNRGVFASMHEHVAVQAALAGDQDISTEDLIAAEHSRLAAVGEDDRSLARLRLDLAAVAIKRGQLAESAQMLQRLQGRGLRDDFQALQPMYWQLMRDLTLAAPEPDLTLAADASERVLAGLRQQQRRMFDPVTEQWVGDPVPGAAASLARIRAAAEKVYARRRTITQNHP